MSNNEQSLSELTVTFFSECDQKFLKNQDNETIKDIHKLAFICQKIAIELEEIKKHIYS